MRLTFAFLFTIGLLYSAAHGGEVSPCQDLLTAKLAEEKKIEEWATITSEYRRYHVSRIRDNAGMILYNMSEVKNAVEHPAQGLPWRHVSLYDNFKRGWRIEDWHARGKVFQFLDVGFKNFEDEAVYMNSVIAEHILSGEQSHLKIEYGPRRRKVEKILRRYRWLFHGEVMETYRKVKEYLGADQLLRLQLDNLDSTNIDVFGLVEYDRRVSSGSLTDKEMIKRLRMTLQISYYGEYNFFDPSLREVLRTRGIPIKDIHNRLPFEKRVSDGTFIQTLYEIFDRKTSCEFTRLAKFVNALPPEVVDRFLYEAFSTAYRRGMKTVFASGDEKTIRIFKRYGFKFYGSLPTKSGGDESLMYMKLDDKEFGLFINRLLDSGLRTTVRLEGRQ